MKTIKNKRTIGFVVLVIIVVLAVFAVVKAKKNEADMPVAKQYGIVVSTIQSQMKEVVLTLPYLAQTENDKDVKITSRVAARINYIKASGTKVKKGEVIAQLDNTSIRTSSESLRSEIKAAQVSLKNLEETHKRTKELLAIQGASIEQYQKEENNLEVLRAKLSVLQQKEINITNTLTYSTITSPVDGVISKTMVNKGDVCMPGHPVAHISAGNGFYLLLRVPTDLPVYGVKYKGKEYQAISLNSTFNNLAEYKVYLSDSNFTTGDRVEVDVIVFKGKAVKLPFDAILNRDGNSYVLTKEKDKALALPVSVVRSGEEGVVVSNNNLSGKEIIVAKQDILLRLLGGVSVITKNK